MKGMANESLAGEKSKGSLFVVDGNDGPCVRSLCRALGARGWTVRLFRPYGLFYCRRAMGGRWGDVFRWRSAGLNVQEQFLAVPGFRRATALSNVILRAGMAMAVRAGGPAAAVIYTLPFYERLARTVRASPSLYLAYDAYRYYAGWDEQEVIRWEGRMLGAVATVCAVSRQLQEDFAVAGHSAHYVPNAASEASVGCPAGDSVPEALRGPPGPIVGCVGMVNSGYDWDLVRKMAEGFPRARFVFLGHDPLDMGERAGLAAFRNVVFTGFVAHGEAMRCLRWFDVCLNPMLLTAFNHRRCPLRLYDYLCTDKPVLSTSIREAVELKPHVAVGADHAEMLALLNSMLGREYAPDLESRRAFMREQTWAARAERFERILFGMQQNRVGE